MSYAPGAPKWVKNYPVRSRGSGVPDGLPLSAKMVLWDAWSRADHRDQRGCESTTVFVKPRPDDVGSPTKILEAHVAEGTGMTVVQVRDGLSVCRRRGMIKTRGLTMTLFWRPHESHSRSDISENQDDISENRDTRESDISESFSDASDGFSDISESFSDISDLQLTPQPPNPPTTQQGFALTSPSSADQDEPEPESIAQFWDWYNRARRDAYQRWRPSQRVREIPLTPRRRKDLLARVRQNLPAGSLSEQLELARHVVRVIVAEVDCAQGGYRPWKGNPRGWDTMRSLDADHWLRATNFERDASKPEPKHAEADRAPLRIVEPDNVFDSDPLGGLEFDEIALCYGDEDRGLR